MAAEAQHVSSAPASAPVSVGFGGGVSSTASAATDSCRTVLVIDGSYAYIGARKLPGGRIDFVRFREELERQAACRFRECWFFDHENVRFKSPSQANSVQYTALKLAPPHGPQFQLKLYAMKKYTCHCRRCGHDFTQNVQKGVDNGIATKILSLAYENVCDRFILFAGDGDFYDSLNQIKNVLRKDLWVIGYRDTVSADLQQLASHVIWMDDLWPAVQIPQQEPAPTPQTSSAPAARTMEADQHTEEQSPPPVELGESPSNTRRVRLERNVNVEGDADQSAKARQRSRNRRRNGRNRSRSRSRSRSPRRKTAANTQENGEDHPLFYFDTGATRKERQGNGVPGTVSRPAATGSSSRPARRDVEESRPGKRKRSETPSLAFELSDMSSEEDEQHPAMPRAQQNSGIMIIDLASDSE